ncbi:hypothetical protein KLEP7_gp132 [Pseudaeromonas phage vB_PpeM_ KLEP7]|nr:hypothetical protein KLEP7_gp132 [Pseudaeromonas phage vB_PpeM_ KLEP7]
MLEDTSFSVTESYLKSLGVNIANYSEVQDMIYLLGGSKYKIDINYDVFVRCPDMPSVCRKDNVYVSVRRKNAYVGSLCDEGENLDINNQHNLESARLVNSLDYTDNYLENARIKQAVKQYRQRKHKSHSLNNQVSAKA